jgi:hypothetical protein
LSFTIETEGIDAHGRIESQFVLEISSKDGNTYNSLQFSEVP